MRTFDFRTFFGFEVSLMKLRCLLSAQPPLVFLLHAVLPLLLMTFILAGCSGDDNPYYTVREVRTPVLQLLQKSAGSSAAASSCQELATAADGSSERWCQQYPVRPDGQVLLRFVLLSPEGGTNEVQLESLRQLQNLSAAARGARIGSATARNTRPLALSDFEPTELKSLNRTLLEAPLRIEERYFLLKLPSAESLVGDFFKSGALPGYTLTYQSKNPLFRGDRGLVSFYVLPDPASPLFQAAANGQIGGGQASPADLENARKLAASNVPPKIVGMTPDGGSLPSNQETRLELSLQSDPDAGAASRVQWFVSSGKITNSVSRKPKWKPEKSGAVAAFAMLRDLQGGSDFTYRVFTAQ